MSVKGGIIIFSGVSWTSLGVYRGLNRYDYFYAKNKNKSSYKDCDAPYLYTMKIADGVLGGFLYIIPFLLPITVPKELYRLEVNLRGLEKEKNTDYYHSIF
jgi:hypothetical protein